MNRLFITFINVCLRVLFRHFNGNQLRLILDRNKNTKRQYSSFHKHFSSIRYDDRIVWCSSHCADYDNQTKTHGQMN